MFVVSLMFTYSCKQKHEEMTFTFSKANVTENSVNVTVTPSDMDRNYFLGILPSANVKDKDDVQIISEASGSDAFKKFMGDKSYGLNDLQPETDYVALAFACDDAEKVARYTMRTLVAQDTLPGEPENPDNPVDPDPEVPQLELKADKTSILANGEDEAVFTVKLDGKLLIDGYKLMNVEDSTATVNKSFSTTEAGIYTFVAVYNDVLSNELVIEAKATETPDVPEINVQLQTDKAQIYNDGEDKAAFTVTVNGEVVTEGYQVLNAKDSTALENNIFVSTEVGVYVFVAIYNNVASNEVKVEVVQKAPVVTLVTDKDVVKNNGIDKATFKVFVDGEIKTDESVIYNVTDDVNLEGDTFSTEIIGTYVFKAIYGDYESAEVTITVKEARVYAPGDLYEEDGVKGVVFYVENGGVSGLIMSLDEEYLAWSTENVWANCTSGRGDWNTEDMLKLGADKYPAAKWCVDHGEGWYLPSSQELHLMWTAVSNGTHVFDHEFIKLYNDKLETPITEDYYWSSNETSETMGELVAFMEDSVVCLDPQKTNKFNVRAVYKF